MLNLNYKATFPKLFFSFLMMAVFVFERFGFKSYEMHQGWLYIYFFFYSFSSVPLWNHGLEDGYLLCVQTRNSASWVYPRSGGQIIVTHSMLNVNCREQKRLCMLRTLTDGESVCPSVSCSGVGGVIKSHCDCVWVWWKKENKWKVFFVMSSSLPASRWRKWSIYK